MNIGQHMTMNTPSVFVSLETASISSLSNKIIQPFTNAQIQIPSIFNSTPSNDVTVSLRVSLYFIIHFSIIFKFTLVNDATTRLGRCF